MWKITAIGAIIAFLLKVYYHDSYLNRLSGSDDNVIFGLFRKIFAIKYLFPIPKDIKSYVRLAQIANMCIYIFYILLGVTIILKFSSIS